MWVGKRGVRFGLPGIVSEPICAAEFVFLLWVLYRLLGAVNKTHASLMVILGLVFVPIMFVNTPEVTPASFAEDVIYFLKCLFKHPWGTTSTVESLFRG